MADQSIAGKQQAETYQSEAGHSPVPTRFQAEHDPKEAHETAHEIPKPQYKIEAPPAPPGEFKRVWIWVNSWSVWNWIKRKADEASLADWAMVFFTFVLAATTIVFTVYAKRQWQEMRDGGIDTHALAQAAIIQSQQTESLATTAGVQAKASLIQVDKLDAQVTATNNLAAAAARQSFTAEKALTLASAADRPWIGFIGPTVSNLEADKPIDVTVTVTNAGKSPARMTEFLSAAGWYVTFPKEPDYSMIAVNTISHSVLVPGTSASNRLKTSAMPQPIANSVKNGTPLADTGITLKFYVYSRVIYEDIRTRLSHHTWSCFYWDAKTQGYNNCPEYNDAD